MLTLNTESSQDEVSEASLSSRRQIKPWILILGAVVLATVSGFIGYQMGQMYPKATTPVPSPTPSATPEGVACTLEARICPDGTAVGRSGPNCEFAACPTSSEPSSGLLQTGTTYQSSHYPYSFMYPEGFTYQNTDAGWSQYQGYIERAYFEKALAVTSELSAFYVFVTQPVPETPYDEPVNLIFDQNPTGTYQMQGFQALYLELPKVHGDGAFDGEPKSSVVVQFKQSGALYKIVFEGASSIQDPLVSQVLQSFVFNR